MKADSTRMLLRVRTITKKKKHLRIIIDHHHEILTP